MMAKSRLMKKSRPAGMKKRLLSLAMALSLMVGMVPAISADNDAVNLQREKQIVNTGGTRYYKADGTSGTSGNHDVAVTKTVLPTGIENQFQIQLQVETTQNLQEISVSPDAAVVLVMDVSNSMEYSDGDDSRLGNAMDAAETFLENYVQEAGDAKRMVSIVEFGSNAKTVLNWSEANSKQTGPDGKTKVTEAVSTGLDNVGIGFGYYECNIQGTHSHTEDKDYIERASKFDDWNWTGYNRTTCKVCGVSYNGHNERHYHCTFEGCPYPKDTDHTHSVTTTEYGPHGDWEKDGGGTNIEGGMMLARNLLLAGQAKGGAIQGIDNVYVILLTDGSPTFYVNDNNTSANEIYFIKGSQGCNSAPYGNCNNENDYKDIPGLAAEIKGESGFNKVSSGAKLYSLTYGSKDLNGNDLKVNGTKIAKWLTDTVKVDHNYASADGSEVATNLGSIGMIIGTIAQAWKVTDPMPEGSYVTFAQSNLASEDGSFSDSNSSYLYYWDNASKEVVWDLKQDIPVKAGNTFTYTLTYNVILHPEQTNFVEEQPYATNGQAVLEYLILNAGESLDNMTADQVKARIKTANFDIPTVKGYLGEFDFMKYAQHQDSEGNDIPLSGAKFTLSNLANQPLEKAAGAISDEATSKSGQNNETPKGQVAFASIPSGYTYTLSENPGTFTSDGIPYQPVDTTWNVQVVYGEVTGTPGSDGVRNPIQQQNITLDLTKTWNAATTAEIQVDVMRKDAGSTGDGEVAATLTLNGNSASSNNSAISVSYVNQGSTSTSWKYSLTVPKYNTATGGEYTYWVEEHDLSGYNTTYGEDGMSITNTAAGTTSVFVEKDWLPIDGKEMENYPSVEITLIGTSDNGPDELGTVTLPDLNGSLSHEWTEVPLYDEQGYPYTYSVSEAAGNYQQIGSVTGAGTESDPFVITNAVLEGTVSKTVTKTWYGGSNTDRPAVEIELLRDGKSFSLVPGETKTTYTLTSADATATSNVWSHTFEGLPQYEVTNSGVHEYKYTVKELTQVNGYKPDKIDDLHLANTRTETVSIEVTKAWNDGSYDFDHDEVQIQLLRNGVEFQTKTTVDGVASFGNLERFDTQGVEYAYTVSEVSVPANYSVTYDYGTGNSQVVFSNGEGTATVTNTLNDVSGEHTSVNVAKIWQHPAGTTAPDVTFTVIQKDKDGTVVNSSYRTYTMEAGTTTHSFTDLEKYYYEEVTLTGTDPETQEPTTTTSVEKYEYQYEVVESAVDGYNNGQPATGVKNGTTFTFTNTKTGKTNELTVSKVWKSVDSTHPEAVITLQRKVDGGQWDNVATWRTSTDGTHSWGPQDKYASNGQLYTYQVVESTVSGYSTQYSPANGLYTDSVSSITITNTQSQDQTGSLVATKTWNDNGNDQNTRTDITLHLKKTFNGTTSDLGTVVISRDGVKASTGTYDGEVTVTQDTANKWTITFSGLEKYAYDETSGNVYACSYSVTEDSVTGYQTNITNGKDIVNTLKQGTTSKQLVKTWIDPVGTAHPNVTFTLTAKTANGTEVTSVTGTDGTAYTFPQIVTLGFQNGATAPQAQDGSDLESDGATWYYKWSSLPKYTNDQQLISYEITEGTLSNYDSQRSEDGVSFTNTIKQQLLSFSGTKIWDMSNLDADDYLKPNAEPVYVALYYTDKDGTLGQMVVQDGAPCIAQVQPTSNGDGTITGSFEFKDLPRYNLSSGAEYFYTVREVEQTQSVDGETSYRAIETGGAITFQVSDSEGTYNYEYTVTYEEVDTDNGSNTTVTNTYQDPEYYFYRIDANYMTYFSDNNLVIYSATNINVTPDSKGYVALTPEQRAELTSGSVTVDPSDYATRQVNGENVAFDFVDTGSNVSVQLDEVNHMYVITLNYERHLYTLDVQYVFPTGDKPTTGYENYSGPVLVPSGTDGNYADPGEYLGNDTYSGLYKAAPAGFKLSKVTVEDSDAGAHDVSLTYNEGSFNNHDVTVIYYYERDYGGTVENPVEVDASLTITKVDDNGNAIVKNPATFGLFTDAACTTPVSGFNGTTDANGKLTITASDLVSASSANNGVEKVFYLKELTPPTGYAIPSDQPVWELHIRYDYSENNNGTIFEKTNTWVLDCIENGSSTEVSMSSGEKQLAVINERTYGYLEIEKTVTGLRQNEYLTYTFDANGPEGYRQTGVTVEGNGTESTVIKVPTGNYTISEVNANISAISQYSMVTSYSVNGETGNSVQVTANNTEANPAKVTVTNAYTYNNPETNYKTISGSKVWSDDNNRDGLRPASIRVQLYVDGKAMTGKWVDVAVRGNGTYSYSYDSYLNRGDATVKEIGYTDSEGNYHEGIPAGYTSTDGSYFNSYTVTNTHEPAQYKGLIMVEKEWASGSPQEVTLRLYANGVAVDGAVVVLNGTVDSVETEAWKATFPGTFYKYENGNLIDYSVVEDSLGDRWSYNVTKTAVTDAESNDGIAFKVTNSYHSGGGSVDYYKVTVNYYDKDTGDKIATSYVSDPIRENSNYDVTAYDAIAIEGYAYDSTTGDALTGRMNSDKVINVWYVADETDIEEPDVPGGELPVDPGDPGIDIEDPDVPTSEIPATGDTLMAWIAAAAVSGMGLIWLAITGKKRKDEKEG